MGDNKVKKVILVDATLRDGEQTAGVVFAREEKLMITRFLDMMGWTKSRLGFRLWEKKRKKRCLE
ncbi:2-isopropylmalate synthase [Fervidicola ferrireducens]|uniref:2-isopropylmalate synthase n=1 Tax=Fervidicola ferrireducens TaxID=520764 RepID=A0A140L121_9FIRM|nr:hypothetical protein [Fervidicola ferrireducens]KXG74246.1 2-isopropylmalate synthase [Fervidicola ferrireducens]